MSVTRIPLKVPECATCVDYQLVEGVGGMLKRCPDCGPEIVTCPVHKQRVTIRNGVLVGRCWECASEAAQGLQWMQSHPAEARGSAWTLSN